MMESNLENGGDQKKKKKKTSCLENGEYVTSRTNCTILDQKKKTIMIDLGLGFIDLYTILDHKKKTKSVIRYPD